MRITITQAEIEAAIRNYTLTLIAVREDTQIDIKLSATRGDQGYTAVIDINPNGGPEGGEPIPEPKAAAPAAVSPVSVVQTKPAAAPKAKAVGSVFKKPKPQPVEAEVEAAAVTIEEDTANQVDLSPEAEAVAEKPVEAPRSIFSKLHKPVNTPTVESNAA